MEKVRWWVSGEGGVMMTLWEGQSDQKYEFKIFRTRGHWQTARQHLYKFFLGYRFPKAKQKINYLCNI